MNHIIKDMNHIDDYLIYFIRRFEAKQYKLNIWVNKGENNSRKIYH